MNLQNFFAGFHGGAIAAVAEAVSIACARTVVAKDKEIFLGELSISYLASAKKNVSSSELDLSPLTVVLSSLMQMKTNILNEMISIPINCTKDCLDVFFGH